MILVIELIKKYKTIIVLSFIVLVGFILRYKGLTTQSYWLDELFSASFSHPDNSYQFVFETTVKDVHPPLYQSILWLWFKLFGFTEYTGRLLSVIFGTLVIPAIYILGKELFNKQIALYASLLASVNIFLIHYAQEARSYSLFLLLTILSYLFLIRLLKTDGEKKELVSYLFFSTLLLYTHYFGFFLIFSQLFVFIFYVIYNTSNKKYFLFLGFFITFSFIIALLPIAEYIIKNSQTTQILIAKPSILFFVDYIQGYIQSEYLFIIFLLLGLNTLYYLIDKKSNKNEMFAISLLVIWIVSLYVLPYIRSITAEPLLTIRNTIVVIPAIFLLVSYGLYKLPLVWLKVVMVVFIIAFSLLTLYPRYYTTVTKTQWRELIEEVSINKHIPIYEIVPYGEITGTYHFLTYTKLLKLDLSIKNINDFRRDLKEETLPECFWLLDAQGNHIDFKKSNTLISIEQEKGKVLFHNVVIDSNARIEIVKEIKLHDVKGSLFSYKRDSKTCLNKLR